MSLSTHRGAPVAARSPTAGFGSAAEARGRYRGLAPAQDLRRDRCGRGRLVLGGRGPDLRPARPERGGQDDHRRVRGRAALRADSGQIRVLGLDPARALWNALRFCPVGVQLQSSALPAKLKVGELLDRPTSPSTQSPPTRRNLPDRLGLAGQARRLLPLPLGRSEAAALDRPRSHRPAEGPPCSTR